VATHGANNPAPEGIDSVPHPFPLNFGFGFAEAGEAGGDLIGGNCTWREIKRIERNGDFAGQIC
jgi:hypothetical protein